MLGGLADSREAALTDRYQIHCHPQASRWGPPRAVWTDIRCHWTMGVPCLETRFQYGLELPQDPSPPASQLWAPVSFPCRAPPFNPVTRSPSLDPCRSSLPPRGSAGGDWGSEERPRAAMQALPRELGQHMPGVALGALQQARGRALQVARGPPAPRPPPGQASWGRPFLNQECFVIASGP